MAQKKAKEKPVKQVSKKMKTLTIPKGHGPKNPPGTL
jgi:hypothetical protein